jgi:hypothetical protein
MEVDPAATVRYDVEVIGHEEPFKWEVQRWMPHATQSSLPNSDCRGEATTYEEALFAAADAAHQAEWDRVHSVTRHTEHLFTAPLKPQSEDA